MYTKCARHGGEPSVDFVRVGEKVISRQKIIDAVDEILALRSKGFPQADVASKVGVDRTFISRLETLGEIRKGGSMALIGFPISNCDEVTQVAREEGVEYVLVMTDKERWRFVQERSGVELLNELMRMISTVRRYEKVVLIGSDRRLDIMKALLDRDQDVATLVIGRSPMVGDVYINLDVLRHTIRQLKG